VSAAALLQKPIGDLGVPRTKPAAVKLPPSDTKRWTMRRKAAVVEAVRSGMITMEQVCRRYSLSVEEFLSWHNTIQSHGVGGLQITKLQNYRYARPKRG
jgi:transposase-like protein